MMINDKKGRHIMLDIADVSADMHGTEAANKPSDDHEQA